jgi:hypothetical protein
VPDVILEPFAIGGELVPEAPDPRTQCSAVGV